MGKPAVKQNDQVTGQCTGHQIPAPNGSPMAAPPMPFAAKLLDTPASTVFVEGQLAVVEGASGPNLPVHAPVLHASDPQVSDQSAKIEKGSSSVFFDGHPAAYSGCTTSICVTRQGSVMGTASTVLIGA
jgi:uncharacterized Zn-binding protein involved in type VI secretion